MLRDAPLDLDKVAIQGGAVPSGHFFQDPTVEWTTVYGQRAVVLITKPGDEDVHPGFGLWWHTADAAIGITATHADIDTVRAVAAGIQVGPSSGDRPIWRR